MYLCVDVGGTKTLLAVFTANGELEKQLKFETPSTYKEFLQVFEDNFKQLGNNDYRAGAVAVPGRIDRKHGRVLGYGTLKWKAAPIEQDIEAIADCPIIIENDAKLAGLSEASLIINEFKRVLYVTIGTGISDAVIMNGVIDPALADSEGGQMWLDHHGKHQQWEDFASGSAIFKKYGQKVSEIQDEKTWRTIANDIAVGLIQLIVVIEPEVVVFGGGVGAHFNSFGEPLNHILKTYATPLTPLPILRGAQRPEEAVIYGCYEIIRQKYGNDPQ